MITLEFKTIDELFAFCEEIIFYEPNRVKIEREYDKLEKRQTLSDILNTKRPDVKSVLGKRK